MNRNLNNYFRIFFRFMCAHLKNFKPKLLSRKAEVYDKLIQTLKNQALLRIMSCIQIANKLNSSKLVTSL